MANGETTVGKFQRGGNTDQLTEEFLKNHLQDPMTLVQKGGNDNIFCSHSMSGEGRLMPRGPELIAECFGVYGGSLVTPVRH